MAIALTDITDGSGSSTTNATSHATASMTLPADELITFATLVCDETTDPTGSTVATTDASSFTFEEIASISFNTTGTPIYRIYIFRALAASAYTGTITVSHTATREACHWSTLSWSGVDTSGTNGSGAVVQSDTTAINNNTAPACTLAAFGSADNVTYMCTGYDNNARTITWNGGLTGINSSSQTFPNSRFEDGYQLANDTDPDATLSGTADHGEVAIEIKAGGATATISGRAIGRGIGHGIFR